MSRKSDKEDELLRILSLSLMLRKMYWMRLSEMWQRLTISKHRQILIRYGAQVGEVYSHISALVI